MTFEDITIVGIDSQASTRVNQALFDVALELSESPPSEWVSHFDRLWMEEWYMMKKRVEVSGSHIIITCVPAEIETEHLPHLKAVVAGANLAYRSGFTKTQMDQTAQAQERQVDVNMLDKIGDQLFKKK